MTKAHKYLNNKRHDILINLSINNIKESIDDVMSFLNDSIEKLIPLRHNQYATEEVINEILKAKNSVFITSWLIKSFAYDKSFIYGYIYLAQRSNRESGSVVYPITEFPDYTEIENLIEEENLVNINSKTHINSNFKCLLDDDKLKIIFEQLIKNEYIEDTTNMIDFLCVFGRTKPNKLDFRPIKWILKNNQKKPHKTALRAFITYVIGNSPDQKTVNSCFTDEKGNKILLAKPKIEPNTQYWTDKFESMTKE